MSAADREYDYLIVGSGIAGLSDPSQTEPFFNPIFGIPALQKELRNRVREVLDLLYTPEQTGMLIDEMASFIYQPNQLSFVDADRAMWDYNPILVSQYVGGKAGHGRFYESAVDNPVTPANEAGTFAGMMQKMKNYIVTRRNVMTSQLLTAAEENLVPTTPVITRTGGGSGPIPTDALSFTSGPFVGKSGATFAAMKWRLAEVTEPGAAGYLPFSHVNRRLYEADPENTFESPELTSFAAGFAATCIAFVMVAYVRGSMPVWPLAFERSTCFL